MQLRPVSLTGRLVRLEPLRLEDASALAEVGLDADLWRLQPRPVASAADMRAYVEHALAEQRSGVSLPFVVRWRDSNSVIGSTRYMDIALEHKRVEIGGTWITRAHQDSGANIDAKLLLLGYAFGDLGVQKVVFKTEALNEQSRRALLALGAVEEGLFRKHLIAEDGRVRNMVYFSILAEEWPAVRQRNEARLERHVRHS